MKKLHVVILAFLLCAWLMSQTTIDTNQARTRSGNSSTLATAASSLSGASAGVAACADGSGNVTTTGCSGGGGGGGGANKIPFDSCNADQSISPGASYWRTVQYSASAGVTSADIATWEYFVGIAGTVICKMEVPSNASGTIHVFLDLAANDSTAGHTAAFKVCYAQSTSQNINNLSYTCTATQNYTSTATAYANTRLDFTTAVASIGEYFVANIIQNSGGTNTAPVRMVAKAKVF